MSSTHPVINLAREVAGLTGHWQPRHITTINDSHSFKVARIYGTFIWHAHPETDELFYCVSGGPMTLELADAFSNDETVGKTTRYELRVGDMVNVPRGRRHRPIAHVETGILMIEKVGTVNTGDMEGTEEAQGKTVYVVENDH